MKNILKQIYLLLLVTAFALPQGVFARTGSPEMFLPQPGLMKVFVKNGNALPAKISVSQPAISDYEVTVPTGYSCQVIASSFRNGFSPQTTGSINFNQPSDCFRLTMGREAKAYEQLSVSSLPESPVKVSVLRSEFLLNAFPKAPMEKENATLPLKDLGWLVLVLFSPIAALLGRKVGRSIYFVQKEVSIFRLGIIRC